MTYEIGIPFFVIAQTHQEFIEYKRKKISELDAFRLYRDQDFKYVDSVMSLKGYRYIRGAFVGNWKNRKDIKEIIQAILMIQMSNDGTKLPAIITEFYYKEVKYD